ncbi:hypothetical protein, partial [Streptomyces boncukensis]|uniref:hypothetical protein n=1 Tax=Streptomyces boncukensis TaxID=2711219 RepID=UPI0019D2A3F5
DGTAPGAGYALEISSLRRIMSPLEESVVAAHKLKDDWKPMASGIHNAATIELVKPTRELLSSWGFGMGRVAEHADAVVATLKHVIAAYMLADLLRVKDFAPTEENMAKLPWGENALAAWKNGYRIDFDPAPPLQDGDGGGGGDGGARKDTQKLFPGADDYPTPGGP